MTTAAALFDAKITSHDVMVSLVKNPKSPFFHRKHLCVLPNASHGMRIGWEADLLACSKTRRITEVEIKVSRSDFIADQHKQKFRTDCGGKKLIDRFFYAMPAKLWERCQDAWRAPGAGVIVIGDVLSYNADLRRVEVIIDAERRGVPKVSDDIVINMQRLVGIRFWEKMK
jgi:hypothetical protein